VQFSAINYWNILLLHNKSSDFVPFSKFFKLDVHLSDQGMQQFINLGRSFINVAV
jgi:hypothetical protein